MASKDKVLKRIQDAKKGKPTSQDITRLKTWQDAGEGSRDQEHGYNRALRNMQRSVQQDQAVNEVDAKIASSYIKENSQQLLNKSQTFMNMLTWFVGTPVLKGVAKAVAPLVPKAAKVAAPKVAKVVKDAQKVAGKLSGSTAAKAAAKKALETAQRKAQRARISARNKVLGDIAKGGEYTKGLAKTADRAGRTAYNKVIRQHDKAAKATTAARKAKNLRRAQVTGAGALVAVASVKALKDDKKPEKKKVTPPAPRRKPTGREVFWERARRTREEAKDKAAEKKAITESRAGRHVGIGAGRKSAKAITESRAGRHVGIGVGRKRAQEVQPTEETQRELKFWEGGVRYINLPEWLGGGRIKVDSSPDVFDYGTPEYKHGGRIKKSVKKSKVKPRKAKAKIRKRASLRGGGAELRGG